MVTPLELVEVTVPREMAPSTETADQVYRLTTHGSNRLGGNATADVLTFGRIAAKTALDLQ